MRGVVAIAALAAVLAFPLFAEAQFRGGFRPFTPRAGGMARGFSGFRGAPAPFRAGGFRGTAMRPPSFGRRHGPWRGGFYGRRGPFLVRRRFVSPYAYPAYYPFYNPFFEYPSPLSYVGFPDDYEAPQEAQAFEAQPAEPPAGDALVSQVQALTDEVSQLRDEQALARTPAPQAPREDETVPAVLVYRDGRRLEARNFAVYGPSVWVFGNGSTRKIPLADLNLEATRKLNDERGSSFSLPAAR